MSHPNIKVFFGNYSRTLSQPKPDAKTKSKYMEEKKYLGFIIMGMGYLSKLETNKMIIRVGK